MRSEQAYTGSRLQEQQAVRGTVLGTVSVWHGITGVVSPVAAPIVKRNGVAPVATLLPIPVVDRPLSMLTRGAARFAGSPAWTPDA